MAEKTIGGSVFQVEKMPATEATRNLIKLTKILGPGLSRLSDLLSQSGGERDAAAMSAISEILMRSDAEELTAFIVQLAETARVKEGGSFMNVIYDIHLTDLSQAFELVAFVLQVNYRDFFAGKVAAALSAAKQTAGSLQ